MLKYYNSLIQCKYIFINNKCKFFFFNRLGLYVSIFTKVNFLTLKKLYKMISLQLMGFELLLYLNGFNFNAYTTGKFLFLSLDYSHIKSIEIPSNILIKINKDPSNFFVYGLSQKSVVLYTQQILKKGPPRTYSGKGVQVTGIIFVPKSSKKGVQKL